MRKLTSAPRFCLHHPVHHRFELFFIDPLLRFLLLYYSLVGGFDILLGGLPLVSQLFVLDMINQVSHGLIDVAVDDRNSILPRLCSSMVRCQA